MRDPKDITINGKQLSEILESHKKWLMDEEGGERANLVRANLESANLESANLVRANLESANLVRANLVRANLESANLESANLESANLVRANLESANLVRANLESANLVRANLVRANLVRANLYSANLVRANLESAKNIEMVEAITSIVPEGDIIGWKKCNEGIVKLLIPAKARRSNATGRKCRAEYAIDKAHFTPDGKRTKEDFTGWYQKSFAYKVGETIRPDKWDENRWDECSHGIHFFITRWEAENYST
jgi:uncharacterized protein DUF5758/pentapeptide repeat protein